MKTNKYIPFFAVAVAITLVLGQMSQAADVFQLFISAKGFSQAGATVQSRKVTSQKIVNAALGIDPDTNVNSPPTQVLGVVIACSNITDVVIWDTVGGVPLATIGTVDLRSAVVVSNLSYAATMDIMFISTNRLLSSVNGVDSDLSVGAKGLLQPGNCLGFFNGKFVGTFNSIGGGGNTNTVVIPLGKVSLGAKLGTV